MPMEYSDCISALRLHHPEIADRIARFTNLEHILNWLTSEGYPLGSLDMITQDEFCHDLLLPLNADWLVCGMS
jgi:hypothetical protein